jgi:leader peptidase (prepilin peptidase)/N-methyltransferase
MLVATLILCASLGVVVGAYLRGVIERVPAGQSALAAGGFSCRDELTGARGAAIVVTTVAVFALLALQPGPEPELPAFLYLGAVGVALTFIDLDCHRLPNQLTLPSYPIGIALLGLAATANRDAEQLLRALIAMVALFAFYYLLALIHPRGMGFGDVKLAGVLGLYLGWQGWGQLLLGTFLGFLASALAGIVMVAFGQATLKSKLPFGPFMLGGALAAIVWGEPVVEWYLASGM